MTDPIARRAFLAALAAPAFAGAQTSAPAAVRIIIPASAGGPVDVAARALGDAITKQSGTSFVMVNQVGAGGVIGHDAVAKAAPDGHTLLLSTTSLPISQAIYKKVPYDSDKSFRHIAIFATYPNVILARPSRFRDLADLVEQARKDPNRITYATAGNGSAPHFSAELLASVGKFAWSHVPYKGAAPALTDLIGGQVDVSVQGLTSAMGFLRDGRLKALAVTSATRQPALPDVPSVSELFPGYEYDTWLGLSGPAGLPDDVDQRIAGLVKRAVEGPEFAAGMQKMGARSAFIAGAQFQKLVGQNVAEYTRIARRVGMNAD
jgi:tripartite-type tricarboxylate transporter receptor subunit TctC